jgi:glycosyltransferase involved in cell wall biosynthesis
MLVTLLMVSGVFWVFQAFATWKVMSTLRVVESLPEVEPPCWPTVSLIVPARDEGLRVRAALETRLSEGYPALEVVLVDDRSVDDTGAQARALAANDARLTVSRVDELPDGWLGKVNALRQGLSVARGEWFLFSDADVHIAPGTMQ